MVQHSLSSGSDTSTARRRIVLTAFGSLGDIHPYIAIALGLKERGHDAVLATGECYRQKVESLGLGFRPLRPDSDFVFDPGVMRRLMDPAWGTVRCVRDILFPELRQSYEDTLAASEGADLLVSHPLAGYVARLVAEKTGVPWASTMITPLGFFSAHDPPLMPAPASVLNRLRFLGPSFFGPLLWLGKRASRFLARPWYRLRAEIGLPPTDEANPLADSHSPLVVLALFSGLLAAKQPDWPPQSVLTGFPFYDRDTAPGLPPDVARFLDDGPPPLVFTLGISAAMVAGSFFRDSVAAAKKLGRRTVLVVGKNPCNRPASLPAGVIACDYAPFSELFPRAAVVVHAGGIGTTGLAMRSGRPSLVVPFSHDQPDNAERLSRLGVARTISYRRCTAASLTRELGKLLNDSAYSSRAAEVSERVRQEDGVRGACEALEGLLDGGGTIVSR